MRSNRSYAMAGFLEHAFFGLFFLSLLLIFGVPFAGEKSTAWWLALIIYIMTVGAVMYLSVSLAAYGKSMIFGTTFDVDIGEMSDLYNEAKTFKIIFMLFPLALVGLVLSPVAFIVMLFNIKTFFKAEQEYLDKIDEEWETSEVSWNEETAQMDSKRKEKAQMKKAEREAEKQRLRDEHEAKKAEQDSLEKEKIQKQKDDLRQKEEYKKTIEKKEVGYIKYQYELFTNSPERIKVYHDGKDYIAIIGAWGNEQRTKTMDDMVSKLIEHYKRNNTFKLLEVKEY